MCVWFKSVRYWRRKIGIYNKHEKTVNNLYIEFLKRPAIDDEIGHFSILLENNEIKLDSLKETLSYVYQHRLEWAIGSYDLIFNVEKRVIVKDAYMDALKRPATDDEVSFLTTLLKRSNKKLDRNIIHKILLNPDELKLASDWTHYSVKYWND